MDYFKIYQQLISAAKIPGRKKIRNSKSPLFKYYENHHIVPKCIGGQDQATNLVLLTAREHFIAHRLLCKIHPESVPLKKAVLYMSKFKNRNFLEFYVSGGFINSREYERMRIAISEYNRLPENVRIWINDGVSSKLIQRKFLSVYLEKGWVRGKLSKRKSGEVCIHKDGIGRSIPSILKDYYLKAGWTLGGYSDAQALKFSKFDVSYSWISNGKEKHYIGKDALPFALEAGWKNSSKVGPLKKFSKSGDLCAITKNGIFKYVKTEFLPIWQKAGWVLTYFNCPKNLQGDDYQVSLYVHKEDKCCCVSEDVYPYFIEEGWVDGKSSYIYDSRRNVFGKTFYVNNGFVCKAVTKEELSVYLEQGWFRGRINSSDIISIEKEGWIKQINEKYLYLWEKASWKRVVNPKKSKPLCNSPYKSSHKIFKNDSELAVSFDVLPHFIEEGWQKGRIFKSKNVQERRNQG